jgi:hypothetical protein
MGRVIQTEIVNQLVAFEKRIVSLFETVAD